MQPKTALSIFKLNMELDSQQIKAVKNPTTSMAISAGAGSGKTRVLVERYIKLIVDGIAETEEVLTITFTKKAAAELKSRIRERLNEAVLKHHGTEKESNAKKALSTIESAPISTIHSFCQTILKNNAIEAGIEPDFQVFESNDSTLVIKEVSRRVITKFLKTGNEKEKYFIRSIRLSGLQSIGEKALKDRYKLSNAMNSSLTLLRSGKYEESIEKMIDDELNVLLNDPKIKSAFDELKRCKPTDISDALALIRDHTLDLFAELSDERSSKTKLAKLVMLCGSIKLTAGSQSAWEPGEKDIVKSALKTIREMIKDYFKIENDYSFINEGTAKKLLEGLDLFLTRLFNDYDDRMSSLGAIDFNGLLYRTMNLLSEKKEIAAYYRKHYKQILVDEFQDTDDLQMDIIKVLAAGGENDPVLFLVGDENQSIYKFRGAEVSNFQKMIEKTGMEEAVYITKNYRSQPDLIQFYNRFFSLFLGDSGNGYEESQSVRAAHGSAPKIQFLMPILGDDEGITIRESEADILAKQVISLVGVQNIRDGDGSERPLKFSDIGILFQKMTQVHTYLDKFAQMGIPYYMKTRSGFHEKFEIIDLLNFLRVIERQNDEYSLAAWLRSPIVGLSDNALFLMGADSGFESYLAREDYENFSADDKKRILRAKEMLWNCREFKDSMGISEFVQKIVDEIAYIPFLLSLENGTQKALNIYKLLDQVSSFERTGVNTFGDLVENMDTIVRLEMSEGEAQASSEEDNVITIMTVHGSKGLQFPVVFLPDLEATFARETDNFKYDTDKGFGFQLMKQQKIEYDPIFWVLKTQDRKKNLAERRRLLYVAMTRAKDYLFFVGAREYKKDGLKSPKSNTWMRYILDGIGLEHADEATSIDFAGLKIPILRDLKNVQPLTSVEEDATLPKVIEYSTDYMEPIKKESRPTRITPTQLMKYVECPWKYSLEESQGIEEPESGVGYEDRKEVIASGKLFGTVAHKIFSQMDFHSDNDIPLINKVISQEEVEKIKHDAFRKELQNIMGNFRKTELFKQILSIDESRIKREEDFFIEFGGVLIEGTFDLIYEWKEKFILIDYKTDEVDSKELEVKVEQYKPQLMLYAKALKNIIGEYPLKTMIYFTKLDDFKEIVVNDISILEVENHLKSLLDDVRTNMYVKNGESCYRCGFHNVYCEGV